jgi:hypothetical protein
MAGKAEQLQRARLRALRTACAGEGSGARPVAADGGRWDDRTRKLEPGPLRQPPPGSNQNPMKDGTHEERSATEAKSVRVVVADDHTMFRRGLARILASCGGMEVGLEIPNDEWALRLSLETMPDVVLMEVQRPARKAYTAAAAHSHRGRHPPSGRGPRPRGSPGACPPPTPPRSHPPIYTCRSSSLAPDAARNHL